MRASRTGPAFALLVLGALGSGVSGCYSKATAFEGKFTFAYPSMVEHENFVKPIAPGAKLEVHAFMNGTTEELQVLNAKSSKPDVVEIAVTKAKSVVLLGKAPGVAEIEIRARAPNGVDLVDKMFFHVAKPVKHPLEHSCTEEKEAAYVVGDEVWINHSMTTADARPVVGFDYAPLAIEPRGSLELLEQPQAGGFYRFVTKAAKTVTLKSTIDDHALTLRIVERQSLSDATLLYAPKMLVGHGGHAVAIVRAGQTTLCSQNALTKARSLTPEICTVTARLDDSPDGADSNREQLARIRPIAFGICKFEVTLPELAKGKGVVLEGNVKVGREEYPGEGSVPERMRSYLDEWSRPLGALASAKEALALVGLALLAARRRLARE